MTLSDYQSQAAQTAVFNKAHSLPYLALGLNGEAGEVAEVVKKMLRDDAGALSDERRERIVDELGDVLWYLAMLADAADCDLDNVAHGNLQKLSDRKARGVLGGSGDGR